MRIRIYFTVFQTFLCLFLCTQKLVARVQKELESWNLGRHGAALPQDPVGLSWWVAASLPMEDSQRSLLLRHVQQ